MDTVNRAELLGLPFDPATMKSAVDRCMQWCEEPRAPHIVVTANASILCMMRRDRDLASACKEGDLILADGMSVVWALRAAGTAVPERVTGVDLMAELLAAAAARRLRIYLLGAKHEVVSELARLCQERYPGVVIAGFRDGYFSPADHSAIVEEIRESKPDILFIGMQSPFKETWAAQHQKRLDVPVIMGVGGSFDVHAGYVIRAPRLFRSTGMEWFWRLLMEPRKMWKRYLMTNTEFIWVAGREIVARRLGIKPSKPSITTH